MDWKWFTSDETRDACVATKSVNLSRQKISPRQRLLEECSPGFDIVYSWLIVLGLIESNSTYGFKQCILLYGFILVS